MVAISDTFRIPWEAHRERREILGLEEFAAMFLALYDTRSPLAPDEHGDAAALTRRGSPPV